MKKMKGLLGIIVALFAIAPITIANAAQISEVNVNVTLPAVGSNVVYNENTNKWAPAPTMTVSGTNSTLNYIATNMYLSAPVNNQGVLITSPEPDSLVGVVQADTYYWIEFAVGPANMDIDTFANDVVIKVNGSTTGVIKNEGFNENGGLVYAKMKTAAATPAQKYTVKFENVNPFDWDGDENPFADQEIDKNGHVTDPYTIDNTLDYDHYGYLFDGWYTDAEFKHAFSFNTAVTSNLTLYAKFVDFYEIADEVIDTLKKEVVIKSSLTEKEALELYSSEDFDEEDILDTITSIESPANIGDDILITSFINRGLNTPSFLAFSVEYKYKNYAVREIPSDSIRFKITYADTDKHDAELDEKADPYNGRGVGLPGLVDESNIPNAGSTDLFTEEEMKNLHYESINRLKNLKDFDLININDGGSYLDYYEDDSYWTQEALTKGDSVYGYTWFDTSVAWVVKVDENVLDNRKAYIENVKDRVISTLEAKGYTNVEIDDEDYDYYYVIRVLYGNHERGEYFRILMLKDSDKFMIAKNLSTDYTSNALYELWAESYSENKEDMFDDVIESIENLKVTLEGEGYDFFDAYELYSYNLNSNTATLTFTVGTENNNRRFKVLHEKHDGTIEEFTGIVKDGQFTIEITETSPFAVGLGEVVKATNNNPQTFDPIILSVLMLALSAIGLIGGSIYLTKSRLN